jgi:hypothetical protein
MSAVGCVLASEQHLRLRDTRAISPGFRSAAGGSENNGKRIAKRVCVIGKRTGASAVQWRKALLHEIRPWNPTWPTRSSRLSAPEAWAKSTQRATRASTAPWPSRSAPSSSMSASSGKPARSPRWIIPTSARCMTYECTRLGVFYCKKPHVVRPRKKETGRRLLRGKWCRRCLHFVRTGDLLRTTQSGVPIQEVDLAHLKHIPAGESTPEPRGQIGRQALNHPIPVTSLGLASQFVLHDASTDFPIGDGNDAVDGLSSALAGRFQERSDAPQKTSVLRLNSYVGRTARWSRHYSILGHLRHSRHWRARPQGSSGSAKCL